MKKGGVGYVQPDTGSFPTMAQMNEFILAAGGIPTHTWLNGLSDGEQEIERLLEVGIQTGVAAINVIPDRNYAPGVKDEKLTNLYRVVEVAEKLDLPVVMGTEMNSPGQKFVDDFDSAELKPVGAVFLKGAQIVYAHSSLQRACGLGYTSDWAKQNFKTTADKNKFFQSVGQSLKPGCEDVLAGLNAQSTAEEIINLLGK
jgi:predicted TIM-barrel fold metal-dependent hydrolase